ncbi:MAG: hypothetical protein WCB90_03045 [Methanosarcina sp.]
MSSHQNVHENITTHTRKEQNSDILGIDGKYPEAGGSNLLQGYLELWY